MLFRLDVVSRPGFGMDDWLTQLIPALTLHLDHQILIRGNGHQIAMISL